LASQHCSTAIHHALSAANGAVAVAKVCGREMMPALIIEPMTGRRAKEERDSLLLFSQDIIPLNRTTLCE
jgi:hypothetical protein